MGDDEEAGGVVAPVEEDGARNGFEGPGEVGVAPAAAAFFFSFAEQEEVAEAQAARQGGERVAPHDGGPGLGELALRPGGVHVVELPGDDGAYDRVPKELEALVGVGGRAGVLVGEGAVDQGQMEEAPLTEGDTEGALQALNRHGEDDNRLCQAVCGCNKELTFER